MDCVFGDISKKASVNQGSQVFSCCFLGVLHFVFRSVMHLEGIFVTGLGFVSRFISGCGCARVALPSVDWTASVPVCYLCSFVKHQWTLLMGSVSGLFILFCPSAPASATRGHPFERSQWEEALLLSRGGPPGSSLWASVPGAGAGWPWARGLPNMLLLCFSRCLGKDLCIFHISHLLQTPNVCKTQ